MKIKWKMLAGEIFEQSHHHIVLHQIYQKSTKHIYLKHLVSVKAGAMHLSTQLCLINTHQNKMS